jgi:putative ABC transport system ATP-binding protein
LAEARRQLCGFVFQNLALLAPATAYENVEVPLVLAGVPELERGPRVRAMLDLVDMAAKAHQLPDQLSGGQQQRIGIARALILEPRLVLADEPTGSLDRETGQAITRLLVDVARRTDAAVVVVTHDPTVAAHADRTLHMHSGRLVARDPSDDVATTLAPRDLAR